MNKFCSDLSLFGSKKMIDKLQRTNANGMRTECTYVSVGNRLAKLSVSGDTELYSYDNLYQLTKVETKDKTTEYEYDAVGNRLQMKFFTTNDTNITNYNYNSDNQLLSYAVNETDTVIFIYDANGNQIIKATNTDTYFYSYDYDNNLNSISAINDTNIISYIYSPDGKRLKKYLNGIGTKYFYDADDVLTEYDTNTVVVCRYTNNLGIDDIISSKRNSITEWYHKDALGSVVNLSDNNQNITVSYRYNEFGSIDFQSNSHQNEYTYTGRQIDREAGLYYYRSRYYNSAVGRFTQKDKLFNDLKLININHKTINKLFINIYLYVINNPIRYTDKFGKQPSNDDSSDGETVCPCTEKQPIRNHKKNRCELSNTGWLGGGNWELRRTEVFEITITHYESHCEDKVTEEDGNSYPRPITGYNHCYLVSSEVDPGAPCEANCANIPVTLAGNE